MDFYDDVAPHIVGHKKSIDKFFTALKKVRGQEESFDIMMMHHELRGQALIDCIRERKSLKEKSDL